MNRPEKGTNRHRLNSNHPLTLFYISIHSERSMTAFVNAPFYVVYSTLDVPPVFVFVPLFFVLIVL